MEPTKELLSGTSLPQIAKRYFLAIRPKFLTASILPVFVGTAWGYAISGSFDALAFLLALFTIAAVHAGVNVLNDVYDDINGTDRANKERIFPFTGGSRFIQNEVISLEQMRRWGIVLLAIGVVLGALLWLHKGPGVLLFGIVGIILGITYSAPPLSLASRGLGESAVGIGFGVVPITGAVWLQAGVIDPGAILVAIPVSMWVANILIVNEIPDAKADESAAKRTLVVRFGNKGAGILYLVSNLVAVSAIVAAVVFGYLQLWSLILPTLLMLLAIKNTKNIMSIKEDITQLKPSIETTLMIHTVGCLWLTFWCWWG